MSTTNPTSELIHRRIIVESALRVIDNLESLRDFADKAFYTDDDNDLEAHHVSDSEWFHNGLPFESLDALVDNLQRWADRLRKTINDDLLTDPTNNA